MPQLLSRCALEPILCNENPGLRDGDKRSKSRARSSEQGTRVEGGRKATRKSRGLTTSMLPNAASPPCFRLTPAHCALFPSLPTENKVTGQIGKKTASHSALQRPGLGGNLSWAVNQERFTGKGPSEPGKLIQGTEYVTKLIYPISKNVLCSEIMAFLYFYIKMSFLSNSTDIR